MKKLIIVILISVYCLNGITQEQELITKNPVLIKLGIGSMIDDYGLSYTNRLEIPVVNSVRIEPSFSYLTSMSNFNYLSLSNSENGIVVSGISTSESGKDIEIRGYKLASYDLNFSFSPIELINNVSKSNVKIILGAGYRNLVEVYGDFNADGSSPHYNNFIMINKSGIDFNMGLEYEYLINNNWRVGLESMIVGRIGDPHINLRFMVGRSL